MSNAERFKLNDVPPEGWRVGSRCVITHNPVRAEGVGTVVIIRKPPARLHPIHVLLGGWRAPDDIGRWVQPVQHEDRPIFGSWPPEWMRPLEDPDAVHDEDVTERAPNALAGS